jgi:hypothetical protein
MPYLSRKEYCGVFPGIPMKEVTLPDGTKTMRAININGDALSAAETYKLWNKEYTKWEKECNTKKSTKRKSPKRKSPKRRSTRRKSSKRRSTKRKSPKRRSTKRKSPKRKSPKRRSTKRKSPKRSSKRRSTRRKSSKRRSPRRTSYTRKLRKYYPSFVGKRVQRFERPAGF